MDQNDAMSIGNEHGFKSVMITRFAAMGNVVMTIPVIYSACAVHPDIQFIMVTRQSLTGLFVNRPSNLMVIGEDINAVRSINGSRLLVREMINKYHIDAFIDLQNDSSTTFINLFCRLHGVKTARFNRAMHHKRELTRKTNKVMLPLASSRARYRETFFKVGLPVEDRFTGLYGHNAKAAPELYMPITSKPKPEGIRWIGLAPFAVHPEKEYPVDKMEDVIQMLLSMPNIHIFVFGGDGREAELAQLWDKKYPIVTSLAGNKYGFTAELALLSNLDVMLTMDSANMHLAAITGTPTVSIWGATHYYCGFKGWHQSENDMVQVPLSCRPCSIKGDKPCYRHDRLCLAAIRPETIYDKLAEKLQ